ncbi:MAG: ABC transporter substrate-binding protein [Propionibacteriaceae bacterium]
MESITGNGARPTGASAIEAFTTGGLPGPGLSRRRLLQVAGAGVGALGLAGCGPLSSGSGGGGGAGAQEAEIGVKPAEGTSGYDFLVGVGDKVTEANPDFTYTYTFVNTKVRPQIEQRWRAGNPPDTDYEVFNAQVPSTHDFADKLLDLTEYLNEEIDGGGTWGESFLEATAKETELDGKTYGVVSDTHVVALFYNMALFEELGIEAPATWDALLAACDTLTKAGTAPIAVTGMYEPYMGYWTDYLFMRHVGYDLAREAAFSGDYSDPGFLAAAEVFEEFRDKSPFIKGFEGTDFTAVQMEFFQEKAGMILMGTWLTAEMKDSIPEDFKLGVVPFPQVEGTDEDKSFISASNIMVVNKESEHIDAAIAYMKALTSKETQTARAEEQSAVSAVKDVPGPPGVEGFDELLATGGELNVRHYGLEYVPDRYTAYYHEVAKFVFGDLDAKGFIDALSKTMKTAN